MGTTIRVSDEIADWLHEQKRRGESYDDVLERLHDEHESADESNEEEQEGFGPAEPPEDQGSLTDAVRDDESEQERETEIDITTEIARLDLPGSGQTLAERRAAVQACYGLLEKNGSASRSEFIEQLYEGREAGYSSERGWWNTIGKQGLKQLAEQRDEIVAPAEGEHQWRIDE